MAVEDNGDSVNVNVQIDVPDDVVRSIADTAAKLDMANTAYKDFATRAQDIQSAQPVIQQAQQVPPPPPGPTHPARFTEPISGSESAQIIEFRKRLKERIDQEGDHALLLEAQKFHLIKDAVNDASDTVTRTVQGSGNKLLDGTTLDDVMSDPSLRDMMMTEMARKGISMDTPSHMQWKGIRGAAGSAAKEFFRRGATAGSNMQTAGDLLKSVGAAEGAPGLLAKGAGTIGGLFTGAAALNTAIQNVGEMYQGYRNQGLVRGGGAAEGFQQELSARTIALNPFISLEQAREVINATMQSGYSGGAVDTVTEFITKNLVGMNMKVSDSMHLLQKNVEEGGQSIGNLNSNLQEMKTLAKDSNRSLPDAQKLYIQASDFATNVGATGNNIGDFALLFSQLFSTGSGDGTTNLLATLGPQMMQAFINDPAIMSKIAAQQGYQSQTLEGRQAELLNDPNQNQVLSQVWSTASSSDAEPYLNQLRSGVSEEDVAAKYAKYLTMRYKTNVTPSMARELLRQQSENVNPVEDATKAIDEQYKVQKNTGDFLGGADTYVPGTDNQQLDDANYYVAAIQNLTDEGYNLDDMQYQKNGKWHDLAEALNADSPDDLNKIMSGEYKFRISDGGGGGQGWQEYLKKHGKEKGIKQEYIDEGMSNYDRWTDSGQANKYDALKKEYEKGAKKGGSFSSFASDVVGATEKSGGFVSGSVTINLSPEAAKYLSAPGAVSLSPSKQDTNAGVPGADTQNATPSQKKKD